MAPDAEQQMVAPEQQMAFEQEMNAPEQQMAFQPVEPEPDEEPVEVVPERPMPHPPWQAAPQDGVIGA
eukprot:13370518-Alexandrium_andersonii.AAC.1